MFSIRVSPIHTRSKPSGLTNPASSCPYCRNNLCKDDASSEVEATQSLIRIVGLSATLPNYVDVADFLRSDRLNFDDLTQKLKLCRVSRTTGLFYFDSSFRPVPLEQHFLGIKGKPGTLQSRKCLDEVTYKKVSWLVKEGHQIMVFVHTRKDAVKSALALKEAAFRDGIIDDFLCEDHPDYKNFRRELGISRNKELKELFNFGFGIHHAGMLRSDRNLVERLFREKAIKVWRQYSPGARLLITFFFAQVLCCTATLAWGVNLPAHAGE